MLSRIPLLFVSISCCVLAQTGNLLPNPGFEEVAGERPKGWAWEVFRTGGVATLETVKPHAGTRCVGVRSRDTSERIAWRARGPLPKGVRFVAAGGWYRTEGVAPGRRQGASYRVHFHGTKDGKMRELGLKQVFLPPAEAWTKTEEKVFPVPTGTEQVELQVFNWLTPGKTCWDDVWLRPIDGKELEAMLPKIAATLGLDSEPVAGRSLPYSPADGETVKTNPPPFLWLPVRGSVYSLEVSRTPDFANPAVRRDGMEWCAEMLDAPLAEGTWYWRYGVAWENGQTVWSKTRQFVVSASATPWPYPKKTAFHVSEQRPRLFIPASRLAEFRRRAAGGDLKPMADSLVRDAARWAGEELVAEPAWLPEGKDRGAAYTLTFWTTRAPMDKMERAALAYLLTRDAGAGAEAKRRILHFFAWDPHGSTNVFHNDEPAMWVMMRGSRAYDWTYDLFSPEERQQVEACMLERARDFYKKLSGMPFENNPFESHAGRIIGFLGEAAISLAPEHEEARKWLGYITHIYWGVYPAWGKEDGGWNEGPGYWGAYMSFGLHYVVALREATGIDLSQRPFFKNTPYYRLYLTPPFSQMSPFGDGSQFGPSRVGALMYWFSTLNHDPRIRWYPDYLGQDGGSSILGVVLKDDSLEGVPPADLPLARHFEAVGLTTLHTDLTDGDRDVFFAMRSSPYGAVSHGHNDQNCFVLEAYGEGLAVATGHYNRYGSPHHDGWTRQTKAKCGITIDGGKGQDRGWRARGKITDYLHGDGFDLVRGDATEAYGGRLSKAVREVVHVRPGIFVVRDDLAAEQEHVFEYWLHALDEMKLDAENGTVRIERPKASLTVRFLSPAKPVLSQTDAFDPPVLWPPGRKYGNQWHVMAAQPKASKTGEFLTVLLPAKAQQEESLPQVSRWEGGGTHGVRLVWPDGRSTLVGFANGETRFEGIATDARIFAVTRDGNGEVASWLVNGATALDVGGRKLLQRAPASGVSATAAFGESYGRLDRAAGEDSAIVTVPPRFRLAINAAGVGAAMAEGPVPMVGVSAGESLDLWTGEPQAHGAVVTTLAAGTESCTLRGLRNRRGDGVVQGALDVPPGVYRLPTVAGLQIDGIQAQADGTVWLGGGERVTLRGSIPPLVELIPVRQAARLSGQPQSRLPKGSQGFEAEANWREEGGSIKVSKGGHRDTSGNNNLWAWNQVGHTIEWTLDVPVAGDYELWFVGATECGMAGELTVNDGEPLALLFAPTGGWGRERASEWQAYQVLAAPDKPAVFPLHKRKNRIALANRSGMGLNLDRLVLVPRR